MATSETGSRGLSDPLADMYRQHSSWLERAVKRITSPDTAEDIVQETFLRLAQYSRGEHPVYPRAFLMATARNVLRDVARGGAHVAQGDARFRSEEHEQRVPADQHASVLLRDTILGLPEIYRDVFLLSRVDGMTYEQIAAARGIAVKTVEWRMTRALKLCADNLRE